MRRLSMLLALSLLLSCAAPALAQEDPYQPVPDYNRRQDGVAYAVPKTVTYYSSTCGMDRKCNVYLPADYDQSKSYPLLLLLHGIGGDHKEWMGGVPEIIIGNLIAAGETKEMIIVTPDIKAFHKDAPPAGFYSPETFAAFDNCLNDIRDDLLPWLRENYSIAPGRENTAVAGLSMGGREALYVGLSLPETFGYVGAFAPAPGVLPYAVEKGLFPTDGFMAAEGYDTFIMIVHGLTDDVVAPWPKTYSDTLAANGTAHVYYETPGAHNFTVWMNGLYNFARNLFKD